MKSMEKLAADKNLASRIRFVIKDVLVSRREDGQWMVV